MQWKLYEDTRVEHRGMLCKEICASIQLRVWPIKVDPGVSFLPFFCILLLLETSSPGSASIQNPMIMRAQMLASCYQIQNRKKQGNAAQDAEVLVLPIINRANSKSFSYLSNQSSVLSIILHSEAGSHLSLKMISKRGMAYAYTFRGR